MKLDASALRALNLIEAPGNSVSIFPILLISCRIRRILNLRNFSLSCTGNNDEKHDLTWPSE